MRFPEQCHFVNFRWFAGVECAAKSGGLDCLGRHAADGVGQVFPGTDLVSNHPESAATGCLLSPTHVCLLNLNLGINWLCKVCIGCVRRLAVTAVLVLALCSVLREQDTQQLITAIKTNIRKAQRHVSFADEFYITCPLAYSLREPKGQD